MKYSKVFLDSIGYELAPQVVTSKTLEARLEPLYNDMRMPLGQLEALTGIRERRWWAPNPDLSDKALQAARKALAQSQVPPEAVGALIYAGVCRENFEPATACAVAAGLGLSAGAAVFDVSNACLGVLNGVLDIANRIELGQMRAGLVVSCESAREINESMIERMLADRTMDGYRLSVATLTGGSGAVALLLTDGSFGRMERRLLGGVYQTAPQHHDLCVWNNDFMRTDAAAVLKHGVELGRLTWQALLKALDWAQGEEDKVICHQVGGVHRTAMLGSMGIPAEKDFSTYEYLGNIGTVSLPLTAAIAEERDFLKRGDKVAFCGIGSGLNCLMLGWEW